MSEYKVKFKARVRGLFGETHEGVEFYYAKSAKEAADLCKKEFEEKIGTLDMEEVEFSILDVSKV